jgi:hypothetical protein
MPHKFPSRDFEFPESDPQSTLALEAHISACIGNVETVLHEILSERVHIDINVIAPTPARNYYTLVTTGMSDRPMKVPPGLEEYRYAELLLCLPPDWSLPQLYETDADEQDYWPIRWLKFLAHFPHTYDTWLWASHTVPNGDPPEAYASNTRMCCALISHPLLFGEDLITLQVRPDKQVHFHSFIPIYREEMEYKLSKGFDALIRRLDRAGVTELLDLNRKNVGKSAPFGSIH